MAKLKYTIKNTLTADEQVATSKYYNESLVGIKNPGSTTGPYGNGLKFNDISFPLPRTNLHILLKAGMADEDAVVFETEDVIEQAYFKQFLEDGTTTIEGLSVVESTAE